MCDEIGSQFDCTAFVTVSQNPDIKKFFKDMLYELDNQKYKDIHSTSLDVNHLIDLVRGFISNKRYALSTKLNYSIFSNVQKIGLLGTHKE